MSATTTASAGRASNSSCASMPARAALFSSFTRLPSDSSPPRGSTRAASAEVPSEASASTITSGR